MLGHLPSLFKFRGNSQLNDLLAFLSGANNGRMKWVFPTPDNIHGVSLKIIG